MTESNVFASAKCLKSRPIQARQLQTLLHAPRPLVGCRKWLQRPKFRIFRVMHTSSNNSVSCIDACRRRRQGRIQWCTLCSDVNSNDLLNLVIKDTIQSSSSLLMSRHKFVWKHFDMFSALHVGGPTIPTCTELAYNLWNYHHHQQQQQ